ncbi:MAG: protein-export chaperone SecB [Proteobacteria bacterium]|nr:protein-export chaperone SecB [Pseudomonadota bacterium]
MTAPVPSPATTPTITFRAQYLKDLSFESLLSGKMARRELRQMEMQLRATVAINDLGDGIRETELFLGLTGRLDGEQAFIAELTYAASYHMINLEEEVARSFLNIEVARNIFPYAAAILSQTAASAGLPPVWLEPIDFNGLYRALCADEERAAAARAASS